MEKEVNVVDPHKDLWGSRLSKEPTKPKMYGAGKPQFIFVGSQGSGKTALINTVLDTLSDSRKRQNEPTVALSYLPVELKSIVNGKEYKKLVHFWELGGGMDFEQILDAIATQDLMKKCVIFVCFDLSKPTSILDAFGWIDMLEGRFKEGCTIFLTGTHYDEFDQRSPQEKEIISHGLKAFAAERKCGIMYTSTQIDALNSRFYDLVKILSSKATIKSKVTDISKPILIGPGIEPMPESGGEDIATLINRLSQEAASERREKMQNVKSPIGDPNLAEEDIDSMYEAKRADTKAKHHKNTSN